MVTNSYELSAGSVENLNYVWKRFKGRFCKFIEKV